MGKRQNTYREVDHLPDRALTVPAFADSLSLCSQAIYNQWRRHIRTDTPIDYEIVVYKTHNFVIPKKEKSPA